MAIRSHCVGKHWWMRGLKEKKIVSEESAIEKFKKKLRWDENEKWFDHGGVGILFYAASSNEENVVADLLAELKRDFEGEEYSLRLESRVRKEGYVALGVSGKHRHWAAMIVASPEVVSMLLESGHPDIVKMTHVRVCFWKTKELAVLAWESQGLGSESPCSRSCARNAVYVGANKLETVKVLLDAGAFDFRTFAGGTALTGVGEDVIDLCLRNSSHHAVLFSSIVHYKKHQQSNGIYCLSRTLYRTGIWDWSTLTCDWFRYKASCNF